MVQLAQRAYALWEYECVEQMSEFKHEYYAGSIYAMAGASTNHNRISGNIYAALHTTLRGSPCEPFGGDQRIHTPAGLFTYPDVSVICGEIEYAVAPPQTATNPVAVFEVLSDATRAYDRDEKFGFYRAIPALRDYVLVEQSAVHIEHRSRQEDGTWTSVTLTILEDALDLSLLSFRITLADIYERVEFSA